MKYILTNMYEIEADNKDEAIEIFWNRGMDSLRHKGDRVKVIKEDHVQEKEKETKAG